MANEYNENDDVVLAEDILSDGKTSVLIRSYKKGEPKVAVTKGGYPVKRIPISQWEEINNIVLGLMEEVSRLTDADME